MNTLTKLLFTMVYCGWMVPTSVAFVIPTQGNSVARIQDTSLGMSADIDETALGATERLLIARNSVTVDDGRRQEFGCTVKNDSLDGLRAVVWTMFNVSQVVFPILGLLLVGETMLSMAGYGCYWDAQGYFVLDTLEHIQREEVLSAEVARLAENPFWK